MSSDRQTITIACWLALVAGGVCACADFSRGPAPSSADAAGEASTDGASADGGGTLSFASDVHALLVAGCQRCHAPGQEAGDTPLLLTGDAAADYAVTAPFVEPSAPAASRLLTKMAGTGHGGGTVYAPGTPEYQTILHWIQEGARP